MVQAMEVQVLSRAFYVKEAPTILKGKNVGVPTESSAFKSSPRIFMDKIEDQNEQKY